MATDPYTQQIAGRPPPHDLDAEAAVLSAFWLSTPWPGFNAKTQSSFWPGLYRLSSGTDMGTTQRSDR